MKKIVGIFLISSISYWNILGNGFVWDDFDFIVNWKTIQSWSGAGSLVGGELPERHQGVYRPARSLLYLISYQIFGSNPLGYHLMGIMLQGLVSVMVYKLVESVSGDSELGFFVGLIFAVHPVHTEAISFVTTSFDIWGVLFMLLGIYFFVKRKIWWAVGVSFLAYLFNEITLMFLPLVFLLSRVVKLKNNKLIHFIYIGLSVCAYLVLRFGNIRQFRGQILTDFVTNLVVFLKTVWNYFLMVFLPLEQRLVYDLGNGLTNVDITQAVLSRQRLLDTQSILGFLVLIVFAVLFVRAVKNKDTLIGLGVGFFVIGMMPVSMHLFTGVIFYEKYAYLPSVGFAIFWGYLVKKLQAVNGKAGMALLVVVLLLFVWQTTTRNKDWKDDETLWGKTVHQSPLSAKARNNYGFALAKSGKRDLALEQWQTAAELNPEFAEPFVNAASVFQQSGNFLKVEELLSHVIVLKNQEAVVYLALADANAKNGDLSGAMEILLQARDLYPGDPRILENISILESFFVRGK